MVEITLADGCPVWHLQRLVDKEGRIYGVTSDPAAGHCLWVICVDDTDQCDGYQEFEADASEFSIDLTHRPTALELAARCVDLLPRHSCAEMSEDGTVSTWANGERTDHIDIKALYHQLTKENP